MNQLNLFGPAQELGRSEWSTFNVVRGDHSGMFRVLTPMKQQPRYSNVVRIKRYHTSQPLFLRSVQ